MTEHITDRRVALMREIEGKRGSIILPPVAWSRRSGGRPVLPRLPRLSSGERGEWISLGNCGIRRELAVENALGRAGSRSDARGLDNLPMGRGRI